MIINGYKLDEYQMQVINSSYKNVLVVAGAGSGKSLTIIGKIISLLNQGFKESEILCISLTNDATKNLSKNLANNGVYNIKVYTFHKLSLEILKSHNYNYEIALDDLLSTIINKVLATNNKFIKKSLKSLVHNDNELLTLKRLIITFINLFKAKNYDISYFQVILKQLKYSFSIKTYLRHKRLLLLIINVYLEYERTLEQANALDFNDMINKCSEVVEKQGVINKWKYIIVDEYQDTSQSKFNLLKNILSKTNANFLGVGDDFQSIYRFTGCDLNIFINFTKYLDNSHILQIVNTYRNPQELINVAGKFIMRNKKQITKQLISSKHNLKPIKILKSNNNVTSLKYLLSRIPSDEIMVIGRNNKDIEYYIDASFKKESDGYYKFHNKRFRYLTAHKSKGLEADNVILINITDNILGFPTKIKDDSILKYVNNTKDYYPYEEERRLFYVALTRTKNNVYVIVPNNKSIFMKEIMKDKKYIEYLNTTNE
ncbi:MAG: UvrD-helicase domain-containing protein [Bacilli bacterium]